MSVLTVVCILLKGFKMTLKEFLLFSIATSLFKLVWRFYNEGQKEATLQMIEREIFNTLLENH